MNAWHDFFLAQAGAAGVLTGLVFVGVSINLQTILSDPTSGLAGRAAEALVLLVAVLTASCLLLVPGQGAVLVGIEVLVIGVADWASVVSIQLLRVRNWPTMKSDLRQSFVLRVALGQVATLPFLAAGPAVVGWGMVCIGWWQAWCSRSWRRCSRHGCCSSRSTGKRSARPLFTRVVRGRGVLGSPHEPRRLSELVLRLVRHTASSRDSAIVPKSLSFVRRAPKSSVGICEHRYIP